MRLGEPFSGSVLAGEALWTLWAARRRHLVAKKMKSKTSRHLISIDYHLFPLHSNWWVEHSILAQWSSVPLAMPKYQTRVGGLYFLPSALSPAATLTLSMMSILTSCQEGANGCWHSLSRSHMTENKFMKYIKDWAYRISQYRRLLVTSHCRNGIPTYLEDPLDVYLQYSM